MVAFVVLHYKKINETLECLEALKNTFSSKEYRVIVVDNNTLKSDEEKKIKKYTKDVLLLDKNYGYAKANNIGCKYAIDKYNPEFIIVINNDVFINQKDFLEIIYDDYKKHRFDIMGPWIDSPTKESCNPFPIIYEKEKVIKYIEKSKKLIKIYNSSILNFFLQLYIKIKHFFHMPDIPKNGDNLQEGVALHGCALIFSRKYLEKYEYPFYNETFLFCEEEFLYLRIKKDKLVSLYDPKLKVFHKEGTSLGSSDRKAKIFKETEKIKSLNLLLKEMEK